MYIVAFDCTNMLTAINEVKCVLVQMSLEKQPGARMDKLGLHQRSRSCCGQNGGRKYFQSLCKFVCV